MSLEFLGLSHRISGKIKMPLTVLKYLNWFQRYFKFEKYVKYANDRLMTSFT